MQRNWHAPALEMGSARFWTTFLLAFAVIAFRGPDWWIHPQFFAEDGTIFFAQQAVHGPAAILIPYAGYLHIIPRLIAFSAAPLPVLWQPLYYQIVAISITGACAAFFVLPECRFIIESDHMRMAVSLLAVADCSGWELFANIATVAVFLYPVAFLLLIGRRESIARAIVTGLIVLTSPGLLLFLPLSIWKAARTKSPVAISFLVCAAVQLITLFTTPRFTQHVDFPWWAAPVATVETLAYRVIASTLAGMDFVIDLGAHHGLRLAVVMVAVSAILLLVLYRNIHLEKTERAVLWFCVALTPVMLFETFAMRGDVLLPFFLDLDKFWFFSSTRYFFMPTALFLVVVAFSIEHIGRGWARKGQVAAMIVLFSVSTYRNYRVPQMVDLHWPAEAARIEQWKHARTGPVVVPINPKWSIALP